MPRAPAMANHRAAVSMDYTGAPHDCNAPSQTTEESNVLFMF
jgi:hypothetical protein